MTTAASAPGKVILLGEHAVVYGEPAIAAAVDLRTRVVLRDGAPGEPSRVNGYPLTSQYHAHLRLLADRLAPGAALELEVTSAVPSSAGLGSSAALTVAGVRALLARAGAFKDEEQVAREAYEVEWLVQGGRGSPTDTSVATHGGGVLVTEAEAPRLLWTVERGERRWRLHHLDVPPLTLVIGNTGERGRTSEQVARVARFVKRTGFAREVIRDLGGLARQGLRHLEAGEARGLGVAMDKAHNLLTVLGVSTPKLDRASTAARKAGALGAKLTGSGGGGSMIALADGPGAAPAIAAAIRKAGAEPLVVTLGAPGARLEEAA